MEMLNLKFFGLIFFVISFYGTREIQIVIKNAQTGNELKVMQLIKSDTVLLKKNKDNLYRIRTGFPRTILLVYFKQNRYKLNIDKKAKSIVIDYNKDASKNCYIIHRIYPDAVGSTGLHKLDSCNAVTQIYIYDHYNPQRNLISIRKKVE